MIHDKSLCNDSGHNSQHAYYYVWLRKMIHACTWCMSSSWMYDCMYVCTCVCMYVCVYACVYVCKHVCEHVCKHVCMYVFTCVLSAAWFFFIHVFCHWSHRRFYCYSAISLPGMHAQEGETANSTLENAAQSRFESVKNISYRFNVCMYVWMYVCVYVCVYVCKYVCMHAWMPV